MNSYDLITKFRNHLDKAGLIQSGQHVVLAVSGGMDSICLLFLFNELKDEFGFQITVGHINHQLRTASKRDEAFVKMTCAKIGFPIITKKLNPSTRSKRESWEAWARIRRYQKLEAIRKEVRADVIITAHHGNDQIETILMRMGEGSGIRGLQGIHKKFDFVVRPLLPFSRRDITSFIEKNNIQFIEDRTNQDRTIPRNAIRHEIVRPWENLNPNLIPAFEKMCEFSRESDEVVTFACKEVYEKVVRKDFDGIIYLNKMIFNGLPILLRVKIIQKIIGDEKRSWRRHQWEELKHFFVHAKTGQKILLPMKWILLNDRQSLILKQNQKKQKLSHNVHPADITDCGDFYFKWEWVQDCCPPNNTPWKEVVDGNEIKNQNLVIRSWVPGDTFIPLGMNGHKKISDFLIDEKIDRFYKDNQFVLTANDEIIWVCGHRISNQVKVTSKTTDLAEISIIRKNTQ